ncbi:MAG: TolC family protein [Bacteroidia bacterium]|nr:TolC family protein [Bacteroidia bacterium]
MKRNKMNLVLAGLLLIQLDSMAQAVSVPLSFNTFMEGIRKEHPLYKKAENIARIGELRKTSGAGAFDPQLEAGSNNKFYEGTNYYAINNAELKQGIFAGHSVKMGYENGLGTYINGESKTPSSGLSYVGLEVSLLQGFLMDKRRYEVLKGEAYKNISESERLVLQNDLLFEAGAMYINWLRDLQLNNIHLRFFETATNRYKALVELTSIGERSAIDTVEAKLLLQTRNVELNSTLVELNKSLFQMNGFVWRNDSVAAQPGFSTVENLGELELQALSWFLKSKNDVPLNNPVLLQYQNKSGLLEVEQRYRAELIKPKLDLKYNLIGLNSGKELNAGFYNNNYKWGLGFSMPILLRTPVNNFKISKLDLSNNKLELKNKSAELNNKLNALKNNLSVLAGQIELAKNTLQLSKQLFESEKIRFENNESSLFILNTRESKILESEIKLCETQHKFILNYLYFVHLKGDFNYQF